MTVPCRMNGVRLGRRRRSGRCAGEGWGRWSLVVSKTLAAERIRGGRAPFPQVEWTKIEFRGFDPRGRAVERSEMVRSKLLCGVGHMRGVGMASSTMP